MSGGCSSINEKHYFGTIPDTGSDDPSELVNIFRLTVTGNTAFANVRYLAGRYDERAVELFLNEVKSRDYKESDGTNHGPDVIFNLRCSTQDKTETEVDECKQSYKEALKVVPLKPNTADSGLDSFVIIMSSNADAIAETIGAFSENTSVIQSLNYLINRDTFEAEKTIEATMPFMIAEKTATLNSLSASFNSLTTQQNKSTETELAILQSIAIALKPESSTSFTNIDEAKQWFSTVE
jgi:hypothetical protein